MAETKLRFEKTANDHYRFSSVEELLKDTDHLARMIKDHQEVQVPRLEELADYYKGENRTVLRKKRRREDHVADHRATHNFAKYISQFIQGYMVGVPLKTSYSSDEAINEQLRDINRESDADEHNSELVLDCSIYGRAYELLYRTDKDVTRFTISDVRETFVIYDTTIEMNPIAAVRYIQNKFDDDSTVVYLYSKENIYTYELKSVTDTEYGEPEQQPNYFKGLPIIEYQNNKFRQGDFEDVLSMIDLYDESQSDTANYMTDFNDAMLLITGDVDLDVEGAKKMKESNILMLKPGDAEAGANSVSAQYLIKQYDVSGTEAYKTRLFDNILLVATIPNLLDSNFSGNQTGEALKMKLFGLSQKRAIKERLFKKSLRDRYRLINNISTTASEGSFDVNDISITFTENLPRSIENELRWFASLGGELSQETLLTLLSILENPLEEMEKIEKERPKRSGYDFEQQTIEETTNES